MSEIGDQPAAFTTVIGLEVHVQLKTQSKLFCGCSTQFGAPPNTQTCPVCLGLPGALPVMNRAAFDLSIETAIALDCEIPRFTKWDRKNYFYPDLPKGYQISQFDLPLSQNGHLDISDPNGQFADRRIRIRRAHLEEDAGKSMHDEQAGRGDSKVDLNRTGTPLLEIVSEPDLNSSLEAKTFLNELKLLLTYLGVSDCNMQEGSLRVDANINLHIAENGQTIATPIVEVKNMNSFRAVERALEYEAERQIQLWRETGEKLGDVPKQTRGWDDSRQQTYGQRSKEESSDYRYFPDPDLVPVTITAAQVDAARETLGELPSALRNRLTQQYKLPAYDADVIVNQGRELVDYFERVAHLSGDGKRAANWVQQDVLRVINESDLSIDSFPLAAESLADLIQCVRDGTLDNSRAKDVFQVMLDSGLELSSAMESLGIVQVKENELDQMCAQLIAQNEPIVEDIRNGKMQAIGALIGQARKQNPNINPGLVRQKLLDLIGAT